MLQNVFEFDANHTYHTEDFVISQSNKDAYNAIVQSKQQWGFLPYEQILIIKGPPASGKTYLTHLWRNRLQKGLFINNNTDVEDIMLEKNHNLIIDGLSISWNQEFVLHCFNIAVENNKQLLITYDTNFVSPLPDLESRLNASRQIRLYIPDEELVKVVLFKSFSDNSILISHDVIQYLIKMLPRNLGTIHHIVSKLNMFALRQKDKLNIHAIKKYLMIK